MLSGQIDNQLNLAALKSYLLKKILEMSMKFFNHLGENIKKTALIIIKIINGIPTGIPCNTCLISFGTVGHLSCLTEIIRLNSRLRESPGNQIRIKAGMDDQKRYAVPVQALGIAWLHIASMTEQLKNPYPLKPEI